MIRVRSINLSKLASYQNSDASEDSQYRKLQRFFLQWVLPWKSISKTILEKVPKPKNGYILSMDRILIMKKVLKILDVKDIDFLAMDREFNGKEWLEWLNIKDLSWVLRIKRNTKINNKYAHLHNLTKKLKGHLSARQKRKSIFRLALDILIEILNNPERNKQKISMFQEWISSKREPEIFVV